MKSGPRRQFGPRRSPERFGGFHRVIGPIRPYGNTHLHLGRSFGKTGYVVNGNFCCINRYTRTRIASRPSRAIQLYIAIQRYTLYSYTSLYSIQPLQHPSDSVRPVYVAGLERGGFGHRAAAPTPLSLWSVSEGVITSQRSRRVPRRQNKKYLTSIPLKGDVLMYTAAVSKKTPP